MAIKISNLGDVIKVAPPHGTYFNVDMLEKIVGGWPEPTKIGPIWVIRNEDAKKNDDNYNELASNFFQVPVYGDIVSLSALELPPEWDLADDFDRKFTIDEIDAGVIQSLNNTAMMDPFTNHMLSGFYPDPFSAMYNNDLFSEPKKSEYFYNPNKPKNPETTQENYLNFLRESYDYILESSEENFKDFVMYEDDINIVRVPKTDDRIKTINQVIDVLIDDEAYEKCAKLRDILSKNFEVKPETI